MSTIVAEGSAHPVPQAETPEFDDTAAAGDWGLLLRRHAFVDTSPVVNQTDGIALKRRFCLAYLGNRAQVNGGVYARSRPSVFTPAYIARLSSENASKRFARYPWLAQLLHLLEQLDQDQYRTMPHPDTSLIQSKPRPRLQSVPTPPR